MLGKLSRLVWGIPLIIIVGLIILLLIASIQSGNVDHLGKAIFDGIDMLWTNIKLLWFTTLSSFI